jgi:hypothetical protein
MPMIEAADQRLNTLTDNISLLHPAIDVLSHLLSVNNDDLSSRNIEGVIWILDRISDSLTDMRKEANDGNP